MFGIDFAALAALAKFLEEKTNERQRNKFEVAYASWKERKRWGKQLDPDPMPYPAHAVQISVLPDGNLDVFVGSKLVAPEPIETVVSNVDPIGEPFPNNPNKFTSTPAGEDIPNGEVFVRANGEKFLKVEIRNPFTGDGDEDFWYKLG